MGLKKIEIEIFFQGDHQPPIWAQNMPNQTNLCPVHCPSTLFLANHHGHGDTLQQDT